jgi:heme-degrading monooxygenase HmoA
MHVSLTRLRVRSWRFMPYFAIFMVRTRNQVVRAPGFVEGKLLADRKWTFWTMTAWENPESMRQYIVSGAHKEAMPKLLEWCDEASVAHWQQETSALPGWEEAARRMRSAGRISKVRHPGPHHADLSFAQPRTTGSAKIRPEEAPTG